MYLLYHLIVIYPEMEKVSFVDIDGIEDDIDCPHQYVCAVAINQTAW